MSVGSLLHLSKSIYTPLVQQQLRISAESVPLLTAANELTGTRDGRLATNEIRALLSQSYCKTL
jgi:hypothetical protein